MMTIEPIPYTPSKKDKRRIRSRLLTAASFLSSYHEARRNCVNEYAGIALEAMSLAGVDTVKFELHPLFIDKAERTGDEVVFTTQDGKRHSLRRNCFMEAPLACAYTNELLYELGLKVEEEDTGPYTQEEPDV